jgi:hypothetical protein
MKQKVVLKGKNIFRKQTNGELDKVDNADENK